MGYRLTSASGAELLIEDGRIVASAAGPLRTAKLGHLQVFPGFGDAHVHFPTWSVAQRQVRLEGCRTIEEAVARVAAAAPDIAPGAWLRGYGWRPGDWAVETEPTRELLDRVAPGVPVALMSRDYHSLWLSSAALERAMGDVSTADEDGALRAAADAITMPGGVVERDTAGLPTGVLRERSAWEFRDRWAAPTRAEYLDAMRAALPLAASRGVTSIHDKDGWLGALDLFTTLRDEGSLTLRVHQSVPAEWLGDLPEHDGDEWLRLGYVKAFMDGTLGSGTALRLDGSGVEITSRAALEEIVRRATAAGLPVAVHAIGDLANRNALDAFEAAQLGGPGPPIRNRIEHAQLLHPDDLPRFAALGVTASVQFSHATADRDVADAHWPGSTHRAYPYGALHAAGARLVNGSDAPVEDLDPLAGLRAGVRRTDDDRPAWHPEQCLPVDVALAAIVEGPVWLAGDEGWRGRFVPGHAADLVVLDRDPRVDLDAQVVATMVGGEWTYGADAIMYE